MRSSLGSGSVFFLVLDRVHGGAADEADAGPEPQHGGRRLLVVHEDGRALTDFVAALRRAGLEVEVATTARQALQCARQRHDAVALALSLPDLGGAALLAELRAAGLTAPVVALLASAGDGRMAGFSVTDVIEKPLRGDRVMAALGRAGLTASRGQTVLVVDDDPECLDRMESLLMHVGLVPEASLDSRRALHGVDALLPDAIMVDPSLPGSFELLDRLGELACGRDIPVFLWTRLAPHETVNAACRRAAAAAVRRGAGSPEMLPDDIARRMSGARATEPAGVS